MEVSVDVTRAGDSVGPASVPVGVALDATGVDAGVGMAFVGVEARRGLGRQGSPTQVLGRGWPSLASATA